MQWRVQRNKPNSRIGKGLEQGKGVRGLLLHGFAFPVSQIQSIYRSKTQSVRPDPLAFSAKNKSLSLGDMK